MNLLDCTRDNTDKVSFKGHKTIGKCIYVVDGDTIDVAIPWKGSYSYIRVRFLGVDTPEIRGKFPFSKKKGLEAKKFVQDLLLGSLIALECEGEDNFGRVLAKVYSLQSVSDLLIKEGLGKLTI